MSDARSAKLRCVYRLVTVALLLAAGACTPVPLGDFQALKAGQRLASDCQERLHAGAADFSECLRFVAVHPPAGLSRERWWALGVLHYGWLMQDVMAQSGLDGADAEAKALVIEAEALRRALSAPDAALCPLIDVPCAMQAKRRSERLAGR